MTKPLAGPRGMSGREKDLEAIYWLNLALLDGDRLQEPQT